MVSFIITSLSQWKLKSIALWAEGHIGVLGRILWAWVFWYPVLMILVYSHLYVVLVFCLCQRAAARCTDPSPCLHPPCTREDWVLTAALLTACRPIATASPATPTPSWAPQRPATTWTRSATGSPHRSDQRAPLYHAITASMLFIMLLHRWR